ncbi:MAG: hypothetical protein IIY34_06665 [Clostridia bacterium]|nr:hypothetical protein [Clostridia bacterium]
MTVRLWDVDENKKTTLRTGAEAEYYGVSTLDEVFSGTLTTNKSGTAVVYLPEGSYEFAAENAEIGAFASEAFTVSAK